MLCKQRVLTKHSHGAGDKTTSDLRLLHHLVFVGRIRVNVGPSQVLGEMFRMLVVSASCN